MLRLRSGIARFRSIAIVLPKPRQVGQAPSGLLKLKRPGLGGWISRSQCAQCHPVEKGISDFGFSISEEVFSRRFDDSSLSGFRFPVSEIRTKLIRPLPNRSAVSIDSTRRALVSSPIVR